MDDSDVSAWQTSVKPRALVVGSMIKHCKDRLQARAEIHDFISNMKEDVEKTSRDLSEEDQDSREWYIRKKSCASFLYLKHRDVERLNQITEEKPITCSACQEEFRAVETEYPCRVCDSVFHKDCLLEMKGIHPSHLTAVEKANSSVGWSCPVCDDLSLLLTEDEVQDIIDTFEEGIKPKDGQISRGDFIDYKKKQFDHQMSQEDHEDTDLEFRLADRDGNGVIDWWEFLNYQAKKKLALRDQTELVELLTEKEVRMAKLVFTHMDVNKDGKVSELEARKAFGDYFGQVKLLDRRRCSVIESYARHATARAMALDIKETGAVTWDEFLNGQAKFIIGVRPNPSN
uniref:PHD finger protein 24-like n=1 Tax=Crassostrea virginica TaxID=6565 RepID=A0A8B8AYJ3_CRAVI|nr:PHD finger protein 24-like [Crassostrea virginica]